MNMQMSKKEFKEWFQNEFIPSLSNERLKEEASGIYTRSWCGGCSYTSTRHYLECWKKYNFPPVLDYDNEDTKRCGEEHDNWTIEHWDELGYNEDGEYVGVDSDI